MSVGRQPEDGGRQATSDDRFQRAIIDASLHARGRVRTLLGDAEQTEDVLQEARLRAWAAAPRGLSPEQLQAWMYRTASRVAVDELRRRGRRREVALESDRRAPYAHGETGVRDEVEAALGQLTAHERFLLLLRYDGGFSHAELGALLAISDEAARKRVARATTGFKRALAAVERPAGPTVTVLLGDDDADAYREWLWRAGATVRIVDPDRPGLDLAGADALVVSGSRNDVHPRCYGATADPRTAATDLGRDLRDLAAVRVAARDGLPIVGVCRGVHMINVAFGGDLVQHVGGHADELTHDVRTVAGSGLRRVIGRRAAVLSDHHQAIGRLAPRLRVVAVAPDGLIEAVEAPGRRLVLGAQWHPERGGGETIAEALVAAAVENG